MEGTQTTLTKMEDDITEFLCMPPGIAKNIKYFNGGFNTRHVVESNIITDTPDGKIYYSQRICRIKKNKQAFYLKANNKVGFTVEPNGKISIWFGKNITHILELAIILKHLKIDWLINNLYMTNFITKTILGKIIIGKITNPEDLFKAIVKSNRLKCSPNLLREVATSTNFSKIDLVKASVIAEDLNHWLDYKKRITEEYNLNKQDMIDLETQALILEKKINYNWSNKRMQSMHTEWTKLIMDEEMKEMQDVTIEDIYTLDEFTPKEYTLLKTNKEVFLEGKMMNHCIYTNYWRRIYVKEYLVYHINKNGEEATLGININVNNITLDQIRSKHNSSVSAGIKEEAENFVKLLSKKVNSISFFKHTKFTDYAFENVYQL